MRRPTHTFPNSPGSSKAMTPRVLPDPSLDPMAFEQLIKNRGIRWKHEKASPCPNLTDLERQDHDPNCRKCENGMLFYGNMEIHGFFQANKLERMYEINGSWDLGEAVVTFSAYADDKEGNAGLGEAIDLQHFDKLTCLDYQFRFQELIEFSSTGINRLRYPALTVEFLSTHDREFYLDRDFFINADGYIQWKAGMDHPSFNQATERGEIFTIAYCARPIFMVVQLLHEIRATKAIDPTTGLTTAIRLPQQVLIRRDYLFNHPADQSGQNSTTGPRSGGNINTPD